MKVTLFDYTGAGQAYPERYAAHILIFTKSTRLSMQPVFLEEIGTWSEERVAEELKIMAGTNPGSWEFIHFTFLIQEVTRAFTHQLVRTRTASFAQQSQRVLEIKDFTYTVGPSIEKDKLVVGAYHNTMENNFQCYKHLIEAGASPEDARGILPTNVHTNICMTINMRNFISLCRKRSSKRVQDEYQKVVNAMIMAVEKVYPWFYIFYKSDEMKAYNDLLEMLYENKNITTDERLAMYKKIDIIKSGID
jgi:flavin-dependent thymidylate synthase